MFNEYIKKILPVPIINIEEKEDGYTYKVSTYSNVLSEYGVEKSILKRVRTNKRIEFFDGWFLDPCDYYRKYAIIKFKK